MFRNTIPALLNVATLTEHFAAIFVRVLDKMVIKDLSVLFAIADFAPPLAIR